MFSLASFLTFTHLVGLALAVGAATAKLVLLLRCRTDTGFTRVFIEASRPVTRLIILGLVLLTLSGVGWLLLGHGFTARLVVKLVLVAVIWVLGPVIDNVVEPGFVASAPATGEPPSPAFRSAFRRYLAFETVATGLFYAVLAVWVLF